MSKAKIIDKKSVDSILGEKNLLSQLHHSFIVNMIYSFQDLDYLYLVMDLLPGGNLRYHLCVKRRFNEKQNKFLIGCILVGLEYIHGQCILHRDIKPENLVFDSNGYLRITDFGIAKKYVVNNKKDTSGTVGYLAPEILCNQNHTYSIDYYAVGIIAYELAYGHRPYIGRSKHEVKQLILTQQAHIDYDELPNGYQDEAADFINQLIQRKPKNRLGKDSIFELINHPWLKDFNWEELKEKKMKAHYIPKQGDNFDKKYCLQSNKLGTETLERYKEITLEPNYGKIFKKFDCDKVPDELKVPEPKIKAADSSNNGNGVCNSSNNSTVSVSRNIKLKVNNPEVKKGGNNSKTVNQRNNSMGNILLNRNINENINSNSINKEVIKPKFGLNNILKKESNDINNNIDNNDKEKEKEQNKKEEENNLKFTNELKHEIDKKRETKSNFYKNNEISNTIYNKKIVSTVNDKKKVIRLIDDESNNNIHDKINNNFSKSNSIGNINININYNQKNINNNINPNISIRTKNKSAILDSLFDLSLIEKDKIREKSQEKDDLLISQKLTNLNQFVINNHKQKKLGKNKILSGSNSSLSLFPNKMFNNFKGNYFKKMIKNKILNKDILRLKNKNITNNSLLASNSTQNIFKKSTAELSSSYLKPSKKHFLKREIFNGTFYPNKSSSTKYFFFPRKSTSSSIAKKMDVGNKRLSSSSSIRSLKNTKNEFKHENASSIFPGMDSIFNPNLSKDSLKNHEKNLPFINISLNKKNLQNFRNNFSYVNKSNKTNFLTGNGYFSERIKDNEIKGISKGSLNN
jgi:serine/threonine kinase 32